MFYHNQYSQYTSEKQEFTSLNLYQDISTYKCCWSSKNEGSRNVHCANINSIHHPRSYYHLFKMKKTQLFTIGMFFM